MGCHLGERRERESRGDWRLIDSVCVLSIYEAIDAVSMMSHVTSSINRFIVEPIPLALLN